MEYRLSQGRITQLNTNSADLNNINFSKEDETPDSKFIGIYNYDKELPESLAAYISPVLLTKILDNPFPRYESHEHMDLICYPYIDPASDHITYFTTQICIQKDSLIMIGSNIDLLSDTLNNLTNDKTTEVSFGYLLFLLFEKFLDIDTKFLDTMEEEIIDLEDEVIINKQKKNYVRSIILFRKKLMYLKRYYEQLLDIFNFINGNDNELFDSRSLRLLKLLTGKVDRLYNSVLTLQEYVTQIREAYQAEVDINLNNTMKIFTVITTIFLPLTLIAGWYGMNFDMPEYNMPFAYPIIIFISILVVAVTITYFKKNKWF